MSGFGPLRPVSNLNDLNALRNHTTFEQPQIRPLDLERLTRTAHPTSPQAQQLRLPQPIQWQQDQWYEHQPRHPSVPYCDVRTVSAQSPQDQQLSRFSPHQGLSFIPPSETETPSLRPRSLSSAPSRARNQSILHRQVIAREPLVSQAFLQELHRHAQDSSTVYNSPSRLAATVTDVHDRKFPDTAPPRQTSVSRWGTGVGSTYVTTHEAPRTQYTEVYHERQEQQRPLWASAKPTGKNELYYDTYNKDVMATRQPSPIITSAVTSAWEATVPLNDSPVQSYAETQPKQYGVHLQHPFPSLLETSQSKNRDTRQYATNASTVNMMPSTQPLTSPLTRPSVTLPQTLPAAVTAPLKSTLNSVQMKPRVISPQPNMEAPPSRPSSPTAYLPMDPLPPPKISTVQWQPPPTYTHSQKAISEATHNKVPIRLSPTVDWQTRSRGEVYTSMKTSHLSAVPVNPRVNPFDIAIRTIPRVTTTSTASSSQRSSDHLYEKKATAVKHTRVPTLQPRYESPPPDFDLSPPLVNSPTTSSRKHLEVKSMKTSVRATRKIPREHLRRPPTLESETQSRDAPPSTKNVPRAKPDRADRRVPPKIPIISDNEITPRAQSPKTTASKQRRPEVPTNKRARSLNKESRKFPTARKEGRNHAPRRSRQSRDSVTDDSKGDAVSVGLDQTSKETDIEDSNPVLAQIQSAVSELATICKSLTETRPSGRRSIEKPVQKAVDSTVFSPRTLTELTEKVSRNVTHQVLDSIFNQLYRRDKKISLDTTTDDDETGSAEEAISRHRAFSWSETLGRNTKRRLRQMAQARQELEGLKNAPRDHLSMPENHTVSSTSPAALPSIYGRRPDVQTYGGGQIMYPPWLLPPTLNPFLNPLSSFDPMTMGYFNPIAQMIAASQNALNHPNNASSQNAATSAQSAVRKDSRDGSPKEVPQDHGTSPTTHEASSPISATPKQATPSTYSTTPSPPNRADTLESTHLDKSLRSQKRSQQATELSSSFKTSSTVRAPDSQGAETYSSVMSRSSPTRHSPDVYDGVQIQALHIPTPASIAESFASSVPPIRRVSSGKARSTALVASQSQSAGVSRKMLPKQQEVALSSTTNSSTNTHRGPTSFGSLPRQEVLYTLRIDTFHGDTMENRRRESWAKTREVDVIQVYKDPEILVLPQLVTPQEIEYILRSAEGLWTDHPSPGEIVDEVTHTDAYGRIMTSSHQSSRRNPILVAPLEPNASPCVGRVQRRLAASAQMEVSDVDSLYLLRYPPGSYLPAHVDGHYEKTAIIFLNDVGLGGGSIAFLKLGLQIQPQEGTAVLWSNMKYTDRGRPQVNGRSIHRDQPHPSDEKLILLCLFKERNRA